MRDLYCQWHGKFTGERTACCIHHRELDRKTPAPPVFTLDEALQMFRNLGIDVECGACMAVAFTGAKMSEVHTCQP